MDYTDVGDYNKAVKYCNMSKFYSFSFFSLFKKFIIKSEYVFSTVVKCRTFKEHQSSFLQSNESLLPGETLEKSGSLGGCG